MNKTQLIVLWIGIIFLIFVLLLPPIVHEENRLAGLLEPKYKQLWRELQIGQTERCKYCAIIILLTGGLLVTLKDKKKD